MRKEQMISPDEYVEYTLIDLSCKKYDRLYGWQLGVKIIRISKWLSGNGCGAKQAYFIPASDLNKSPQIAWDDHVKEVTGQLEFEF